VKRSLYKRLAVLEGLLGTCPRRPSDVLFLDHDGFIQWDGSAAMKEWAGKHVSAWPAEWFEQPWCITTVKGLDPPVVLGDRSPPSEDRTS
jgi:hypothetical protein